MYTYNSRDYNYDDDDENYWIYIIGTYIILLFKFSLYIEITDTIIGYVLFEGKIIYFKRTLHRYILFSPSYKCVT